jgi:hypothetical protein
MVGHKKTNVMKHKKLWEKRMNEIEDNRHKPIDKKYWGLLNEIYLPAKIKYEIWKRLE